MGEAFCVRRFQVGEGCREFVRSVRNRWYARHDIYVEPKRETRAIHLTGQHAFARAGMTRARDVNFDADSKAQIVQPSGPRASWAAF